MADAAAEVVRGAWTGACAGTVLRRPGDSAGEMRHVMAALVRVPPRTAASRISAWLEEVARQARSCDRDLLGIQRKFFGALPPEMAVKTIVGALWDYTEEL